MPLALVRTDPLERLLADLRRQLSPADHDALRERFERRRRTEWYRQLRRALRRAGGSAGRDEVRGRARAFPRTPRDDLELSLRRIAAVRLAAPPDERRFVTRRGARAELRRLVGDVDEAVVEAVADLVVGSLRAGRH